MKLLAIFITGAIAGVLGGMGMGGGTLLIPALTAIFGLDQKFSQTINLVSFIPMAAVALFIHAKNGLVKLKGTAVLGVSAMIFSVGASFLEKLIHGSVQKKIFGLFLIVLALWQVHEMQKSGNKSENATFAKDKGDKSSLRKEQKSTKNQA